jgi:hypothetical protein
LELYAFSTRDRSKGYEVLAKTLDCAGVRIKAWRIASKKLRSEIVKCLSGMNETTQESLEVKV